MDEPDDLGLEPYNTPDYYQQFSDEEIYLRIRNRAERLSRFFALQVTEGNIPRYVIQREWALLEPVYQEWLRRENLAKSSTGS